MILILETYKMMIPILIIIATIFVFGYIYYIHNNRKIEGFYPSQNAPVYPYPSGNINNNYMGGLGISSQASRTTYMKMSNLPNSFGKDVTELGKNLCPSQITICISGQRYEQPPTMFDSYGNEINFSSILDIPSELKYMYILCRPSLEDVNDLNNLSDIYIETSNDLPFNVTYEVNTKIQVLDIHPIEHIAGKSIWKISL
jgi:hypothetical protein